MLGQHKKIEFPVRLTATQVRENVNNGAWHILWANGLSLKPDVFKDYKFINMHSLWMDISNHKHRKASR